MTMDPNVSASAGLVDRVKNILLKPQSEWDVIATEPADVTKLYTGYALPLIVLAAVASLIGSVLIGHSFLGASYRVPLVSGVMFAVFQVAAGLIGIFLMAFVANALAPTFGSTQDQGQAHKLAVYSATAGLVGGLLAILPPIAPLAIIAAIYSLVLLWIGLPRLMKTPEDKRVGYFATIIVVVIVVGFVINMVLGSVMLMTGGMRGMPGATFGMNAPASSSAPAPTQGSVTLPGGGSLDLGELEKMGQAYSQGAGANTPPVDPTQLQALLPQSLPGGFAQTSLSSGTAGAMGMNTSQAEAVYQRGDARLTITIVHMGQMAGITAMAGAMGVQESRQDADGYSRANTVEGRLVTEEMSRSGNSASYAVVGRGVAITAQGNGVSVDEARAAVEAIGVQRAEALSAG